MANLAIVGSSRVNGVSKLHSQILKNHFFRDFEDLTPGKIINVTNGVTPRRWLLKCNPGLANLISKSIGPGWERDLDRLERLVPLAVDPGFQIDWRAVKKQNKLHLAQFLRERFEITIDPDHVLDTHIKRIHEYKRQTLNILNVTALYLQYKQKLPDNPIARTFIFAGKAAPGYDMAKRVIHLINAVGHVINQDPITRHILQCHFIPNYNVSVAERIIPATDISEQISTAGMEASGTGNMKFAMNGALTVGTLDGANIEILEAVGRENMFIFRINGGERRATSQDRLRPSQYLFRGSRHPCSPGCYCERAILPG